MERESLYKDRSFSSIIATAYHVQTDYFGRIFRATWLPVLITSVAFATLFTTMLPSGKSPTFTLLDCLIILVTAVITIVCSVWATSRLMSLLNERPRKWNLGRCAILTVNLLVIIILLYALLVILPLVLLHLMGKSPETWLPQHWIITCCLSILLPLLLLPVYYHAMRYLNEPERRFWKDFANSYGRGLRHFGFIFLTLFVTCIILGLLYALVCLPLTTLLFANTASFIGEMNGDTPDLPGYFGFLFWIVCMATVFVLFYVCSYSMIVVYLMYGSIEKQIDDKRTGLSLSENTPLTPQP